MSPFRRSPFFAGPPSVLRPTTPGDRTWPRGFAPDIRNHSSMTLSQDAEEWLHRDVHFVPDGRHLQFDDHTAERLDCTGSADPAITDEGDGLALPLVQRAIERVLEELLWDRD